MSTPVKVSVVIVSRGRPQALRRTVIGVSQLLYPAFEIVVVADPAGLSALPFRDQIKMVAFDTPNISAARNLGIARAAGAVVAFIDDDAVPEPTWLTHLTAPFVAPSVAAAGGYVIGRNGISYQWMAREVDGAGRHYPLTLPDHKPLVRQPTPGRAIRTEGTNCAFRRDVLAELGGFDENFAFYMDETDLNMRLALAGKLTAIVPLAQVHHGYAASPRRRVDRAPRTLFDIGASSALFWHKYLDAEDHASAHNALISAQRARLHAHLVAGQIAPRDVRNLMKSLRDGLQDGDEAPMSRPVRINAPTSEFRRFSRPGAAGQSRVLSGRAWSRRSLRKKATKYVDSGDIVSVFRFSPTALRHRVSFDPSGFWEQVGGLFGRSERQQPIFQMNGFSARVRREVRRVANLRGIDLK